MAGPLVKLDIDFAAIARLGNSFKAAGDRAPIALAMGINAAGMKARTQMRRVLVDQTGLKYRTMVKAIRSKNASPGNLQFEIKSKGGDVRLKFFKAKETRAGVTAAPWNKRSLYAGAFLKGGQFPSRTKLKRGGGNVFKRIGRGRKPLKVMRSGLFIPEEMLTGNSLAAFNQVAASELPKQAERALYAILSGVSASPGMRPSRR